MHAHLTLSEYGQFIGVTSECLTVKEAGVTKEYPLNRLKSVQIAKRGVSQTGFAEHAPQRVVVCLKYWQWFHF
jgi:hypothetical protein